VSSKSASRFLGVAPPALARLAASVGSAVFAWLLASSLAAQTYQVLHSFGPGASEPAAPLIADASGNFYGTTWGGGPSGTGTVFRLNAANNYSMTVLYAFVVTDIAPDGANPAAALIADASGNLYGTTSGGIGPSGTVFRLDAGSNYTLTTLHSFGAPLLAALIADASGNLYGTTASGGLSNSGTVFKLDASNNYALTTLHDFSGSPDGAEPFAAVLADESGNLYGTTAGGGLYDSGTVFRLDAANNYALSTLHAFGGPDGASPQASLIADASGNLYGTTSRGGLYDSGTVFKLDAANGYALTTLHDFDGSDGSKPVAEMIADASGNLYGITSEGGPTNRGIVFKLEAANGYALTTLHDFGGPDGANPFAALLADASGNLFGTTRKGGTQDHSGTVFRLEAAKGYTLTTLHGFDGTGANPVAAVVADASGNLYGTTSNGGPYDFGTVFKLDAANAYARTTLHSFEGPDGAHPVAAVIADASGNLYGTTSDGGPLGLGVVFELDAANAYAVTTLHGFDGSDGMHPHAALIADASGSLYGTTYGEYPGEYGTVFKLDAANAWALTTLHAFDGSAGTHPDAEVLADASGNLYGTTRGGGQNGAGTAFKLDAANEYALTTLHSFGSLEGSDPSALIADASGNLYGTTSSGNAPNPYGSVFKLDAANNYALTTLHSFDGSGSEGAYPEAALIADASGNLYGTTSHSFALAPSGTVFKLDASNNYALATLHNFDSESGDGGSPQAALAADASGNLFGTTRWGGAGGTGVVFSLATGAPAPVTGIAPTSGPSTGATAVTVTGSGFSATVGVRIGGALATGVTVLGSTEITALTPPLPPGRLNDVEVTNAAFGPSVPSILPGGFFSDFLDVPQADIFHADVEKVFRNGITAGCGGGNYCRNSPVTRAQMAVFLLKAEHGAAYVPPACTGVFNDVECAPTRAFAVDWIEQLYEEAITGGCGGGNYCPGSSVTRAQMAVLLLKAEHGPSYTPPACAGLFPDVACTPAPAFAADWIEQLFNEGITGGCGGGNYCPDNPVSRGQMAAFLVRTFGLQ